MLMRIVLAAELALNASRSVWFCQHQHRSKAQTAAKYFLPFSKSTIHSSLEKSFKNGKMVIRWNKNDEMIRFATMHIGGVAHCELPVVLPRCKFSQKRKASLFTRLLARIPRKSPKIKPH